MEGQQNTPRTFHLRKRSNETMSNDERSIVRPAENNLQKIPKMHARQTRADLPQVLFSNALVGGDAQRHFSSCPVFPVRRHMSAKNVEILVHTPFPHGWRVLLVCDVGAGSPANFDGVFSYLLAAEAPFRAHTADASSCRFTQSRWTWTESASRGCVPTVFEEDCESRLAMESGSASALALSATTSAFLPEATPAQGSFESAGAGITGGTCLIIHHIHHIDSPTDRLHRRLTRLENHHRSFDRLVIIQCS